MTPRRFASALLLLAVACATIGDETNFPDVVQTSGVGPFRLLTEAETGISRGPEGRVLPAGEAFGRAMIAGDSLFYASAPFPTETPDRRDGLPEGDVDTEQVDPFTIHRGTRAAGAEAPPFGFEAGPVVLSAQEPWEGEDVYDPWVLETASGARLYYAAAGGIGLAEAPSLDGTFARTAGPLVEDARSPSVVERGTETLMFFEALDTGGIGLARSTDGRSFTVETRSLDLALAGETGLGAPGAIATTTPVGRDVVRVYFEAVDPEGVRQITLAASEDLVSWDRLETGVIVELEDGRDPVPVLLEDFPDDVTVVVANAPNAIRQQSVQVRAIVGAVAPANVVLAEEPPAPEM